VEAIVLKSEAAVSDLSGVRSLWDAVKERMFSLEERQKELGLGDKVDRAHCFNCNPIKKCKKSPSQRSESKRNETKCKS
jgi:hypothetical protein